MKVLLVVHGYPPRYNAGSEVYTQGLAQALADRHEVHVFARRENNFLPEYAMCEKRDPVDHRVVLHIINMARTRERYRSPEVDHRFGELLARIKPNVVHVGHLNHLSTSLILEAYDRGKTIVFTLHDYWLMCPRGQFIQMYPENSTDIWTVCDGQDDRKCAVRCYARYFSGSPEGMETDVNYWTDWVRRRMAHVREVCKFVDLFIVPSHYLMARFRDEFGLPSAKLVYLPYGFHWQRMEGRCRQPGEPFTFGYAGSHIPAKGVHQLIEAFTCLSDQARLRIWGRLRGFNTEWLKALMSTLPSDVQDRIEWMGEYRNQDIVPAVFNRCDAIVVPSIWVENSPLVIHEALQARLPVITADYGGMAELVRHEANGLLFSHRSPQGLAEQMQRFVDDPEYARRLGARDYLQTEDGDVPDFEQHVQALEDLYRQLL